MRGSKEHSAHSIRIRAFKISAIDSPKFELDELFTTSMTSEQLFPSEPPVPPPKETITYPNIRRSSGQKIRHRSPSTTYTSPRQESLDSRSYTASPSSRQPSIDTRSLISSAAQQPQEPDRPTVPVLSPQPHTNGDASTADVNGGWSTAVGRATTGGKSGRVIERLMNENDRLLREKKLATVRLEEELKRGESARSALESLQLSNANLSSLHESDVALLAKRDRRIQQLKEDLGSERLKREAAEKQARETRRERDSTVDQFQRQMIEHKEKGHRAITQYDMLTTSWKSLEDRYLKQTRSLTADVNTLRSAIDTDQKRLAQMDVIMEQMAQESERSKKAKEKISADLELYKHGHEEAIREMRESAGRNDEVNDETQRQMLDLLGHMRYVVNVERSKRN